MKNKNIITFAVLGVAIGAAAYYLLATEDGKKRVKSADSDIKDLTKSLKKLSKKGAKKVSKTIDNYKIELEGLTKSAKETGKEVLKTVIEKSKNFSSKTDNS